MWRTTAMFCGPDPVRRRTRSSWKTTSRTQCRRFSTCQWARTAAAKVLASSLTEEVVAPFALCPSVALDLGLDQADHRQMGHVRLVGIAAVRGEPGDVVTDADTAAFEATVVVVEGLVGVGDQLARIGEEADHVVVGGGPVAFEGEEVITAAGHDRLGDGGLRAHGVDGDQRALEFEPFQETGDGGDLVALVVDRLLAEHEALAGGPGRDGVQGGPPLRPGVAAPRGLAVDGDEIGLGLAQALDPGGKAGLEEVGVEGADHVVEGVVDGSPRA